jgi:hypothetical protein
VGEKSRRDFDMRIVAIPAVILAIGCVALGLRCASKSKLRTQDGAPKHAMIVRGPTAATLVLTDHVRVGKSASGDRVTSIDVATGAQLGLRVFDDPLHCWPAPPAHAWCATTDGELSLLEIPSLATAATVDELLARSTLGKAVHGKWRVEGSDVTVLLTDGHGARVSSATLAVSPADATSIAGADAPTEDCVRHATATVGSDRLDFGPGPRHALLRVPRKEPTPVAPATAPVFLRKDGAPEFLDVGDPSVLLVLHEGSLDQLSAPLRGAARPGEAGAFDPATPAPELSRVDDTPALKWTANLGGTCRHAELIDGLLIIATSDATHRAFALDLGTGAPRWQFTF